MSFDIERRAAAVVELKLLHDKADALRELSGDKRVSCGCATCQRQALEKLIWVREWQEVRQISQLQQDTDPSQPATRKKRQRKG